MAIAKEQAKISEKIKYWRIFINLFQLLLLFINYIFEVYFFSYDICITVLNLCIYILKITLLFGIL